MPGFFFFLNNGLLKRSNWTLLFSSFCVCVRILIFSFTPNVDNMVSSLHGAERRESQTHSRWSWIGLLEGGIKQKEKYNKEAKV